MADEYNLKESIERQVQKVLVRGQRFKAFDQIRQRHFWSSYLFAPGTSYLIQAAAYDIFKTIPGYIGQGYPIPLTTRETNWLGAGRVPDNQNIVITEIGVTIKRPPACPQLVEDEISGDFVQIPGQPFSNPPSNGIAAAMNPAQVATINGVAPIHPMDAQAILYGGILEMSFLTNNVPLGLLADFSQSAGTVGFTSNPYFQSSFTGGWMGGPGATDAPATTFMMGDPTNGVPAAAFRRKLEIPILLQHGEQMGMRINIPRPIVMQPIEVGGTGWCEIRVDWWATESFAELS